jgi:hypothetical protein
MCPDHVCLKRERYPCISQLWARPCDSLFYQRKQVEPVALAPRHQKRRVNEGYLSASRHTAFPQEPVKYEPLVQRRNKSWRSKLSPTEQKLVLCVAIVRFCCTRWSERTLQSGRLEAALAAGFHRNARRLSPAGSRCDQRLGPRSERRRHCRTTHIKEPRSYTIWPRTLTAQQLRIMARKIIRLRTNTRNRRWNTRIKLTNGRKKRSRNQLIPPFEIAFRGGCRKPSASHCRKVPKRFQPSRSRNDGPSTLLLG